MKTRSALFVALLPLISLIGACSDDDDDTEDAARYCELVGELEAAGEDIFGALGDDPSDDELVAAEADLVERMDDELDEMVEVAPSEIEGDVEDYVEAYRARAAGEAGEDVTAQEERILGFEESNC